MAPTRAPYVFSAFSTPEDDRGYKAALRHGFNSNDAQTDGWWDLAGRENLRVLRCGERTVGGLVRVPMGQFYGGKSVRNMGIAGVAIDHAARGAGAARTMMTRCLEELADEGWAVSTLYASTARLYRSVGYELAGGRHVAEAPIGLFPRAKSPLRLREVDASDHVEIERIAREWASRNHGFLDRGPYMWSRIREPKTMRAQGWIFEADGGPQGYAFLFLPVGHEDLDDVIVRDWAARTPEALDALLGLLAGHATIWKQASWNGGVADPLVMGLPEAQRVQRKPQEPWLLRIVDPRAAFRERGWHARHDAELCFELRDETLPRNSGAWTLRVEDGLGTLSEGGSPDLYLGPRGLASLYSGYATAEQLALNGLLRGSEEACSAATALFASPAPCMLDFF